MGEKRGRILCHLRNVGYIISTPDIMGGAPVIAGTRLLSLLKDGYTLEDIHQQFDRISIKMLEEH